MRRSDVASTSFRRHVPTRFLINQCQIITFLILKYDIIENSRIELRGIVLPVQVGGLLGGGKGYVGPPLKLLGGPGPPSSYAYVDLVMILLTSAITVECVLSNLCQSVFTQISLTRFIYCLIRFVSFQH